MFKKYLLGGLLSLGAIALLIKVVDWPAAWQALENVNWWYLLPCVLLAAFCHVLRMLRWRIILMPVKKMPMLPVFSAMSIGFLANNLLPAHLGEFVRAYVLGRNQKVSKSSVLATVVLERIYDGLALLLILLLVLLNLEPSQHQLEGLSLSIIKTAGWLGAALFVGLMIFMQLLRYHWQKMVPLLRRITRFLGEKRQQFIISLLQDFAHGLQVTGSRQLCGIGIYSLLIWVCYALSAYVLFPAFNLALGLEAAILLEVIIALSLLIPSAPAYVGTFQLAAVFTLSYLGADTGVAGGFSLIFWLVTFMVTNIIGLIMLGWEGLSLKDVSQAKAMDNV